MARERISLGFKQLAYGLHVGDDVAFAGIGPAPGLACGDGHRQNKLEGLKPDPNLA
jgi:hypothetical protein